MKIDTSKIRFGDAHYIHCWCVMCGWELWPTAWTYPDPPYDKVDACLDMWQDHHDEGDCRFPISWEEVTDDD